MRDELTAELRIDDEDIDRGGLRIVTTIDRQHQQAAVEAVESGLPPDAEAEDLHVGLLAVRPGDGAITAMYGGSEYSERQLNDTTDAQLQGGSMFKASPSWRRSRRVSAPTPSCPVPPRWSSSSRARPSRTR